MAWRIDFHEHSKPGIESLSFVGGQPVLPESERIPTCGLCGAEQSFFFQIAFPSGHAWSGSSLAMFACTACSDEDHFIPEMVEGALNGAAVPSSFLREYQTNFRFLVFPTSAGVERKDYKAKVKYKRIDLKSVDDGARVWNKVGGSPVWLMEDESPATIDGKERLVFLLQLEPQLQFELEKDAPGQMEYNMLWGKAEPRRERYYQLFIGNAIYLFGSEKASALAYAFTQCE